MPLTIPPPAAITVLCAVMREPEIRPLDTLHPGCFFFDVTNNKAEWRGSTIELPCKEYSHECYTQKLATLIKELLKTEYDYFYYVESDHALCVPLDFIEVLAARYMAVYNGPDLITTGVGASGWLFTRKWAISFLENIMTCSKYCYCPDCIAAWMHLPRATTRVVLTQHSIQSRSGLNKNSGLLPRCHQKRVASGLNGFDFFDHTRCHHKDISPCPAREWGLLANH